MAEQAWIHDLARAEVHPDAEKLLGLGNALDPEQLVEESTVAFLMEIRERFTEYARLFNSYSENGSRFPDIKVYSVAQTTSDFMLFRNQIKLVVSNPSHGVVSLSFANHARQPFGAEAGSDQPMAQEVLAQVGVFREVRWTYCGETVIPEQLAKYYFAEFIRATRERRAGKGNQLLLDQIRALLEEKGLDLS